MRLTERAPASWVFSSGEQERGGEEEEEEHDGEAECLKVPSWPMEAGLMEKEEGYREGEGDVL